MDSRQQRNHYLHHFSTSERNSLTAFWRKNPENFHQNYNKMVSTQASLTAFAVGIVIIAVVGLSDAAPPSTDVWFLGAVGGKSFFAQNEKMNWTAAGAFCASQNMKLAEIETAEEFNFLHKSYDGTNFAGFYWTGARDSHEYRQFSWNSTNAEVNPASFGGETIPLTRLELQNCLLFHALPTRSMGLIFDCNFAIGYPLCQTKIFH